MDEMKLVEKLAASAAGRNAIRKYVEENYGVDATEENRNKVEAVLAAVRRGECTQYRVAVTANLSINVLNRYLDGTSAVDNMRLGVAEKIARFYDQELSGEDD